MRSIKERWEGIQDRVRAACDRSGRNPSNVRVVAVSKKFHANAVVEAYQAGVRIFGESYVQEALPKLEAVSCQPNVGKSLWHFVGALQSKKARQVVGRFDLIQSLDRWSLVSALDQASKKQNVDVHTLVQVNLSGEKTKAGVSKEEVGPFLARISQETGVYVDGLMTFPPYFEDPEQARPFFREAKTLFDELGTVNLARIHMKELSMGVSHDFEVAIEEGATLVRIGTAIFGPRN